MTGYVAVEFRGERTDALLNAAVKKKLIMWDIRIAGPGKMTARLSIRDFFRLRPLLKETGCRVHVTGRFGFPFFLDRLGRRKLFAGGAVVFVAGLYLLSSLVWRVQVEGNEKITTEEILKAAESKGLYSFQWKFRLKKPDKLSKELHSALPGTSWVGVDIQGTKVIIKVVESTRPEPRELVSPRNLIASKNATVTQIYAEKGKPMVQPNTYVHKGEVLISGVIGNDQFRQTVPAAGKVMGLVWYLSDVQVPLVQKHYTYTGESYDRFYLVAGSRAFQVTGYGHKDFGPSRATGERKLLQIRNWVLPVGWLKEKVRQVMETETVLSPADARALGIERAKEELLRGAGKDASVTSAKVLEQKEADGSLHLKLHIEVEEPIAEEQALTGG
ncbi:sporulation protein YqfD [Paenibacillus aurantius]|uniref:Sporulation protein YqfD n=1 Tax=Paenibacillus aurantius TaxID=2918900 RepID=A0AA96LHN2_9BACL|nr:sporulation protein YqfD [Paenibacillus aurantius]WNQ13459.1 sporulation protein YqfD [Paenibacillus aurantius]